VDVGALIMQGTAGFAHAGFTGNDAAEVLASPGDHICTKFEHKAACSQTPNRNVHPDTWVVGAGRPHPIKLGCPSMQKGPRVPNHFRSADHGSNLAEKQRLSRGYRTALGSHEAVSEHVYIEAAPHRSKIISN
jgi:hypothetical protein